MSASDTIFAPASGAARAGIAVIRVSGVRARLLLERVAGDCPAPRRAVLRRLRDPANGEAIDRGLVLWLPGPASFTGEDQAEFHIHGSPAVKAALLRVLGGFNGCRPAEPGEFTRRAFFNGRMDLSAVEGLGDLINAETEAQRRQALWQAEGGLTALCEEWRQALLDISAQLAASLDFSDEGDVSDTVTDGVMASIVDLRRIFAARLADAGRGEMLREGFRVVIAGAPNAGKSTLLNALASRDVAIVSEQAGTTRDVIEVRLNLDGLPLTVVDTAGLRESGEAIEQEGMRRTRDQVTRADLVLWLVAPDTDAQTPPPDARAPVVVVATKADLGPAATGADLAVSAATGQNMAELISRMAAAAANAMMGDDSVLLTRERHRAAVADAAAALDRAAEALHAKREELAAEDVRLAARAIARIGGRIDVEDVLDRVFSQFCIGK